MIQILELIHSLELDTHLLAFVLGSIRLMVFLSFIPFFGPQVSTAILLPLLVSLYMPLHPLMFMQAQDLNIYNMAQLINFILIILKEALIGFVLAYVIGNIFYVAMCAGIVIDNQRGASMAQTAELLTGNESTPLGSILFLAVVTLFFSSGAFTNFLALYYTTYVLWPVLDLIPALFSQNLAVFLTSQLDWLMYNMLLVCAPFILVALLCDVALGLINRFAPQLNVFILSMPIKSGICAFLIIFYFGPFLNHQQYLFLYIKELFTLLSTLFGHI